MSKARDLANAGTALTTVSATELGYLDGVTSAVQTQIDGKEATLPSQTGNTGKYLTTDGSAKSWGTVSQYALPTQTGNSGKYLTTNGTAESWGTVATGGMTLLSTTSLSGATTTISSIDQTYTNLFISVSRVTNASGAGEFRIAPNGNTGITTQTRISNNSVDTASNTYLFLSSSTTSHTDIDNVFSVVISNYANSTFYKAFSVNGRFYNPSATAQLGVLSSGGIATNSAITSLVFSASGGNLSTGTVLVYGVK
jgi:hypothetical protein